MSGKLGYTLDEFKQVISERYSIPVENITDNCSLIEDLGIDSLSLFNMMTSIEEKLDLKLDVVRVIELNTVKAIYDYFQRLAEECVN